MTWAPLRRGLHATHAVTAVVLLATGLLLGDPDLRAWLVGGYGREIGRVHLWAGWAFGVAPVLAALLAARPLQRDLRRRLGPPDGLTWSKSHLVLSLLLSAVLVGSGLLLWVDLDLPLALLDGALEVHLAATWALAAVLPVHLFTVRRKIAARIRDPRGVPESLDPAGWPDSDDS